MRGIEPALGGCSGHERRAADDWRADAFGQLARAWGMVVMGVGDQNLDDLLALELSQNGVDMAFVLAAGVDDRDLALAHDIRASAGKGERTGIILHDPAHKRRHLRHFARLLIEAD